MRATVATGLGLVVALIAPGAAAGASWTDFRTVNIAHQGGEAEAPSNTMYAYERALGLGADMLEVDFHSTADEQLVVLHDATVDRTTEGSGDVYEMTARELLRLDAAHDFVPGVGNREGLAESSYPFRGVRSGERRPPPGYRRADFRIPLLSEILEAYPEVPINIEIKGRADSDVGSFIRNAELLAEMLNRSGRTEGIIVASFNDAAVDRFHELAPQIDLAPSIADVAAFKLANVPLPEGMVAFQVPITFGGVQVTDADFVERAHAQGYAVHVWLSNDGESTEIYEQLLDWNVDGVMTGEPAAFEEVVCSRRASRPQQPWARHCRHRRSSIACSVRAAGAAKRVTVRTVALRLRRADEFDGRCAGRVRLRIGGGRAFARFDFGSLPPASGGPRKQLVRLRARGGARAERGRARLKIRTYDGFARRQLVRVRPSG